MIILFLLAAISVRKYECPPAHCPTQHNRKFSNLSSLLHSEIPENQQTDQVFSKYLFANKIKASNIKGKSNRLY